MFGSVSGPGRRWEEWNEWGKWEGWEEWGDWGDWGDKLIVYEIRWCLALLLQQL